MINLFLRDVRTVFMLRRTDQKKGLKIILIILSVITVSALEFALMTGVFSHIKTLTSAPAAVASALLSALSIVMTVIAMVRVSGLFFTGYDTQQITTRPVSSGMIVISKLLALTLAHVTTSMIFSYPIFFAYGSVYSKTAWFYYMSFAYPLLAAVCEIGIALALLYPLKMLLQYIKKHVWLRPIVALLCGIAVLCPLAICIHKATSMISSDGFFEFFADGSIYPFIRFKDILVPIRLLIDYIFKRTNGLFPYLAIAGGLFFMGFNLTVFFLHKISHITESAYTPRYELPYKEIPLLRYCLRKECITRLTSPGYSILFPVLTVLLPYALYLIARCINVLLLPTVLSSYQSLFPNLNALTNTMSVLAVTLLVNKLSSHIPSFPNNAHRTSRVLPVPSEVLFMTKRLLPLTVSLTSLLISVLVLLIFGMISPICAIFTLLLTVISLVATSAASFPDPTSNTQKGNGKQSPTVFLCAFCMLFVAIGLTLTSIGCPLWAVYLITTLVFGALSFVYVQRAARYVKILFVSAKH